MHRHPIRFFIAIILTSSLSIPCALASPTGLLGAMLGWMSGQPAPSFPAFSLEPSPRAESWELDLSLQNNLMDELGPWIAQGGLTVNQWLASGDALKLNGIVNPAPPKRLQGGGFSYSTPWQGMTLAISGQVLGFNSGLFPDGDKIKDRYYMASLSLQKDLVSNTHFLWQANVGFIYEKVTEEKDNAGRLFGQKTEDLRILTLGTTLNFADNLGGITQLNAGIRKGLHTLGAKKTGDFAQGASLGFTTFVGDLSRLQSLGGPLSAYFLIRGQYSRQPLFSVETFDWGGGPYVNAYPIDTLSGDSAFEAKAEVRWDIPTKSLPLHHMQLYTYIDYGSIWLNISPRGSSHKNWATGSGIGIRMTLPHGLKAFGEYAIPLRKHVYDMVYKNKFFVGISYQHSW